MQTPDQMLHSQNDCSRCILDTAASFAKVAYIRDWIQLDIYINPAFPIG
jgi:hypothetical protein